MDHTTLQNLLEALLFVSDEPVPVKELATAVEGVTPSDVEEALKGLRNRYETQQGGIILRQVGGGYQLFTHPSYEPWVREFLKRERQLSLSRVSLEVLAIIAYRQPVTIPEIDLIRGVSSGHSIKTLLKHHLIKILGRKEVVGRPLLYGTTEEFLRHFGLQNLKSLPRLDEIADGGDDSPGEHP